ncbi:MAG: hypothetical protein ACKOQ2_12950 [Dolichospermum sp.]
MTRPEYTEAFLRARKALRRGKCPSEQDIEHIYQQGWETHLGETEKELLEQCRKEYYDDDSSNQY